MLDLCYNYRIDSAQFCFLMDDEISAWNCGKKELVHAKIGFRRS